MHIHHDHVAGGHAHNHETNTASLAEMTALMKYMVDHNEAHAQELAELARQLDEAGRHSACHKVMDAVASFDVGNVILAAVLDELTE